LIMIEKLTQEQEAMIPVYRDKWINIGLCTKPANRIEAEKAITLSYKCAGLKPPNKIIWCSSPLSQGLTRAIILDKKMIASVGESVLASVRASVRASVWESVWDSVWASVGDSVRASVRASVGDSGYGQHDASWLGFYEYFRNICNLRIETDKVLGLIELAKNSGWFLPYENICWVSERHNILNRDERGRLHSIVGPAVMYPDGWAIYAVHGVRVPADVIEDKKSITVNRIEKEENAEVRRVMIELFGQQKYLIDSGAKEINRDEFGILYRKELPNDEHLVMVKVINSTPEPDGSFKDYFLRVPKEVQTAHEGVAWTYGKNKFEYAPEIET